MSSEAGPWCCREGRDVYFRENVTPPPARTDRHLRWCGAGLGYEHVPGTLFCPVETVFVSLVPQGGRRFPPITCSHVVSGLVPGGRERERGPPARPGRGRLAGRPGAGAPASCSMCRPAGGVWLFLGVSGASRETEAARRPTRSPAWHLRPSPGRVRQRSWPRAVRHGHRGTEHASVPSPA